MDGLTITQIDHGEQGEYRAHLPDSDYIGRLTWTLHIDKNGVKQRRANTTQVPEQIGGRGIAGKLVEAMVDDARLKGFKIVPACSYVVAKFDKTPEWADVKA